MSAADEMEKKVTAVEEKLIQVKMKSSEGNLVYPNQLNEEFYTYSRVIEADAAPTESQLEVYRLMDQRLQDQLNSWTQIKSEDVPKVNALIKAADLPAITVSTTALAATASPSIAPAPRDSTVPSLSPPRQLEATPATPAPTAHIPPESTGQTMTADGFSLPTESTEETPAAPSSPSASPPN
jgi:hypothetical protein